MFALVYASLKVVETPAFSSEDVNKRAANFKRFVLTAEVPTTFLSLPHCLA
jgi:hypothetical protein